MTKNDKEFESLFKSNYTRLYYYALTFVDDAEVCKDIVSDVFETLWHDYDSVRPDGRMAYLYACVKNRCVDHLRRRSVKQRYVLFYATDVREGLLGTDRELEERLQRVDRVINGMPPQRRFVLEQCFFHKKSYREVAAILGITTDGVKRHITTALRNLRDEFMLK